MERSFVISAKIKAEPGQRFINYVLDLVARFFLLWTLLVSLDRVVGFIGDMGILTRADVEQYQRNLSSLGGYFIWVIWSFLYFVTTERLFSRTLAKFITGTYLVSENGLKPNFSSILKRTFLRFIPILDFVSFLYQKGWHDRFSKTTVVKKAAFDETRTVFSSLDELGKTEI